MNDLASIVDRERGATAHFHFDVARGWRIYGQAGHRHGPLVYAAFEYRCTIERVVLELFIILRHGALPVDEAKKIKSFGNLIKVVHQYAGGNKPKLQRLLEFNHVYAREIIEIDEKLACPDVGRLHDYWSKLSSYCHRQLEPSESWDSKEWVFRGYELLKEVEDYLWEIGMNAHFGSLHEDTIPAVFREIRQEFLEGKFDASSLARRLRIASAVAVPVDSA